MLGIRIKQIRKEKGFTQQRFAKPIGVTAAFICDIEKGQTEKAIESIGKKITAQLQNNLGKKRFIKLLKPIKTNNMGQ